MVQYFLQYLAKMAGFRQTMLFEHRSADQSHQGLGLSLGPDLGPAVLGSRRRPAPTDPACRQQLPAPGTKTRPSRITDAQHTPARLPRDVLQVWGAVRGCSGASARGGHPSRLASV